MTKSKAVVTFDYQSPEHDELTLTVGDVITNITKVEDGWCRGVLNGKTGLFPDNFVMFEEDEEIIPKQTSVKSKAKSKKLMKVTFNYEPQNPDELNLENGDIIEVLEHLEDGWAQGRLNNKVGVFPTNFCVAFTSSSNSTAVSSKQTNGMISDSTTSKKVTSKDLIKSSSGNTPKQVKHKERCRVLHDYTSQTSDELTLLKGDIVTIISKNGGDEGWWEGEVVDRNGKKKRGVFPDNFVKVLSPEENESESKANSRLSDQFIQSSEETQSKTHNGADAPNAECDSKPTIASQGSVVKKIAPQIPSTVARSSSIKTKIQSEDIDGVFETVSSEKQLTHYKRPVGPAGRKKPNANNRRKRAKDTSIDSQIEPEPGSDENNEDDDVIRGEPPAVTSPAHVLQAPKKKRPVSAAIQVMPGFGAGASETPNWLQQLKNRKTVKRDPLPVSSADMESSSKKAPEWLTKKPTGNAALPEDNAGITRPSKVATKPLYQLVNVKSPKTTDEYESEQSSKSFRFQARSRSEGHILANDSPSDSVESISESKSIEIKKSAVRSQTAMQPAPLPADKRPVLAAKPKPPPPKSKPNLSKPTPSSKGLDELKKELKSLRDLFSEVQSDHQ